MLQAWLDKFLVPYENLLWLVVPLAAGLVGVKVVSILWNRLVIKAVQSAEMRPNVPGLKATLHSLQALILLITLAIGVQACFGGMPKVTNHPAWQVFAGILYVAIVLGVTVVAYGVARTASDWYYSRAAAKGAGKAGGHLAIIIRRLMKFVLLFIALTVILDHFRIQIAGLLAAAGVASLAVALAAQETLANWIAGFALLVDRPFRVGDRIQLANGQIGDVIEVGLRSTRVLSFDNTVIVIPNSEVAKSQITNFSAPDSQVTIRSTIGIAYGSDVRKAKEVLLSVVVQHPEVLPSPPPVAYFTEFADSCLKLLVICRVTNYRDRLRILDELHTAIKDRFAAEGIEIPFPRRDIRVWLQRSQQDKGD
jgi:small-conductance mechanosensitive channel